MQDLTRMSRLDRLRKSVQVWK